MLQKEKNAGLKKRKKISGVLRSFLGVSGLLMLLISFGLYKRIPNPYFVSLLFLSAVLTGIFFYFHSSAENEIQYTYSYGKSNIFVAAGFFVLSLAAAGAGLLLDIRNVRFIPHLLWVTAAVIPVFAVKITRVKSRLIPRTRSETLYKIHPAVNFILLLLLAAVSLAFQAHFYFFYSVVVLIIMAYFMAFYFNNNDFTGGDEGITGPDLGALAVIFIVAVFFRFYMINQLPPGYEHNTREMFGFLDALNKGTLFNINNWPSQFFPSANLTYLIIKIIGVKLENIRVVSVIYTLAAIPFFFLLVKELYDKRVALFATGFFSVLFICVSMSRVDLIIYSELVLHLVLGLYLLLIAIKTGRPFMFALTGAVVALGAYGYPPGRMNVIIIIVIFLLYGINIFRLKDTFKNIYNLVLVGFTSFVLYLPMLYYIRQSREAAFYAGLFAQKAVGADLIVEMLKYFTDIFFAMTAKGAEEFCYVLPLRPFTVGFESLLLVLGAGYLIFGLRKRNNITVIIWSLFSLLPLLIYPYYYKLYYFRMAAFFGALPIILALGLNVIYAFISGFLPKHKTAVFYCLLAAALTYSSIVSYKDYFGKFAVNACVRDACAHVGTEIENVVIRDKGKSRIYMSSFWNYTMNSRWFCMRCGKNVVLNDVNTLTISELIRQKTDVIIIAEGFYANYFDYLIEYLPNTKIERVPNTYGEKKYVDPYGKDYLYIVVHISKKDLENISGLKIRRFDANNQETTGKINFPLETHGESKIILSGIIEIPEYAKYNFSFGNGTVSKIIIDGRIFGHETLSKGLHRISVTLTGIRAGNIGMKWSYLNKTEDVPPQYFIASDGIFGLLAKYKYFIDDRNTFYQIEPVLTMRLLWYNPRIKFESEVHQYTVLWTGYYNAEKEGVYSFDLDSFNGFCNTISVNGEKIVNYAQNLRENRSIYLNKGPNKIEVLTYSYIHIPDPALFYYRLMVKTPGSDVFRIVSYKELKPYNN